jgi:hypothetical protein
MQNLCQSCHSAFPAKRHAAPATLVPAAVAAGRKKLRLPIWKAQAPYDIKYMAIDALDVNDYHAGPRLIASVGLSRKTMLL